MPGRSLLNAIGRSLLAGDQTLDEAVARVTRTLGRSWRWLKPLVQRYLTVHEGHIRPRHRDVVRFLLRDKGLRAARLKYSGELSIAHVVNEPQRMMPVPAAVGW